MRAHPLQPPDDVGDVRAEDAAIAVHLVDDDVSQPVEELVPLGVVRQDAGVQHVGIGDDDVPGPANQPPLGRRRVAVIRIGFDVRPGQLDQILQPGVLILRQRLRREEVHRPALGLAQQVVEHRQVVTERLPRRRRRHDDRVVAPADRLPGRRLMAVELVDPALRQRPDQPLIQSLRNRRRHRIPSRYRPPLANAAAPAFFRPQPVEKRLQCHRANPVRTNRSSVRVLCSE